MDPHEHLAPTMMAALCRRTDSVTKQDNEEEFKHGGPDTEVHA
jgi:hypothetical protein